MVVRFRARVTEVHEPILVHPLVTEFAAATRVLRIFMGLPGSMQLNFDPDRSDFNCIALVKAQTRIPNRSAMGQSTIG